MKQPLRFEGISVSRLLSRGYPEYGTGLSVMVSASRPREDGALELVKFHVTEPKEEVQTPEQNAARTTFMIMYQKLTAMADDVIVKANMATEADELNPSKKKKRKGGKK